VPSRAPRSVATASAIVSPSGAAQRLNSSISTRLGATCTTNCGRSTTAGTATCAMTIPYDAGGKPSGVAFDWNV